MKGDDYAMIIVNNHHPRRRHPQSRLLHPRNVVLFLIFLVPLLIRTFAPPHHCHIRHQTPRQPPFFCYHRPLIMLMAWRVLCESTRKYRHLPNQHKLTLNTGLEEVC